MSNTRTGVQVRVLVQVQGQGLALVQGQAKGQAEVAIRTQEEVEEPLPPSIPIPMAMALAHPAAPIWNGTMAAGPWATATVMVTAQVVLGMLHGRPMAVLAVVHHVVGDVVGVGVLGEGEHILRGRRSITRTGRVDTAVRQELERGQGQAVRYQW